MLCRRTAHLWRLRNFTAAIPPRCWSVRHQCRCEQPTGESCGRLARGLHRRSPRRGAHQSKLVSLYASL